MMGTPAEATTLQLLPGFFMFQVHFLCDCEFLFGGMWVYYWNFRVSL